MQSVGFTIAAPVYYLLHLLTSPTTLSPSVASPSAPSTNLLVAPRSVSLILPSVFIGYALPGLLMALPSPTYSSFHTHQLYIAVWQIFPLLITLTHLLLSTLSTVVVPAKPFYSSAFARNQALLRSLRVVYATALSISTIAHISSLSISFGSLFVPAMFRPDILPSLHPLQVFVPASPISPPPAKSLGDGFHTFLKFDELIGFTASLIWAIALARNARGPAFLGVTGWSSLLARVVGLTLVTGPAGAVITLIWGRDEEVLGGEAEVEVYQKKRI